MSAKLFTVNNKSDHAEVLISGPIGGSFWDDSGMTEKAFLDALADIPKGKPLVIGVNSEGGSIQDGLGIFNAIKRWEGPTTARIDGYAVSIASVIPLAAQRVISPKSSIWMIHEPWMVAQGNAEDMRKAADVLEKHGETLASIYESETGMSAEEVRAKMKSETWFRGDEAVALGFADESPDGAVALNSFDATKFSNVPTDILSLSAPAGAALQKSNNAASARTEQAQQTLSEAREAEETTNKPAVTTAQNQNSMTEQNTVAADNAAILAKLEALENKLNAPAPLAAAPAIIKSKTGDELWAEAAKIQDLNERTWFVRNEISSNRKLRTSPLNANTLGGTEITRIAQMSLDALLTRMANLNAFTTDFSADAVAPGKVITTRYVTQPSTQDFSSSKAVGNNTTTAKSITLSNYKGVAIGFTDTERTYTDVQLAELFLKPSITAIYEDVMAAAFALVLNANYSSSVTKTSAQLDADVVADLAGTLSTNKAPIDGRTLIISPAYHANLAKDGAIQAAYAYGGAEVIRENRIPRVHGFDVVEYNGTIPGNSENLTGMALHKSALLIASRRVVPPVAGTWYGQVAAATDPESGLTIDVRQHYNGTAQVVEIGLLYGVSVGHGASLVRIKSA